MAPRDSPPNVVRRLDYRPPPYWVDAVDLTFELETDATLVTATLAFRRNSTLTSDSMRGTAALVLNGEQQRDVEITLDGVALANDRYELTASTLTIHEPPHTGRLTIRSRNSPAANAALEGLYVSSGVFCTQCEAEGFRRITYFPDRPDVLAVFTVTMVADRERYPVLLSNGNCIAQGDHDSRRHFATWRDPFPKPCYLFALVAGDLAALEDSFTTRSGRAIRLAIYSTPRNLVRCGFAMASLKRAMRWDEERFGLEYDLDNFMIFCADDFNMGAMENKGLNIFNSRLILADSDTATDDDYRAITAVIGHEYFHNWTGNRVTCRDWFQLSLKEGLTVFRDQEFSSDIGSRAVERISAVDLLRTYQFAEDASPMAHPVRPDEYIEINNFYTRTVYEKGAEVIRMQHTLLGEERFRHGLALYFDRHDGKAVTCDDFVDAMHDASIADGGVGLTQFKRWYAQAGTPVLRIRGHYDAPNRAYVLDVEQHCPPTPGQRAKEPFHIPLAIGLVGPDGRDLPLKLAPDDTGSATTLVLSLTAHAQSFRFVGVDAKPVPSLLRGLSAPVKVEFDYTPAELAFLATHDSDPVNRWDAAQRSICGAILAAADDYAAGKPLALAQSVVTVAGNLLSDKRGDPALLASALGAPEFSYLAGLVDVIDADALIAARAFVLRQLAQASRHAFEREYNALCTNVPYAPTQAQIGPRKLRNACLRYLGLLDDAAVRALAITQYGAADNMTDRIAALIAINHSVAPERDALFARFEREWRDDALVLDKWFALQSMSHRSDTHERVESLLAHPKFNIRNPNRVRSLIGAFAQRNWPAFHAKDGSGYAFVTDQVLAIDSLNPMIAAGLAQSFNQWRRFRGERQSLQRAALERIGSAPELSPDVTEIVERNLGAAH